MNIIANNLFQHNEQFRAQISKLANAQYSRRQKAYNAVAILDVEDLEQEIWCELFESNVDDENDMLISAEKMAEKVAQRGIWKMGKEHFEEIPISQLDRNERRYTENLLYSTVNAEE